MASSGIGWKKATMMPTILNDLVALLNPDQGAKFTEALTAGFLDTNRSLLMMAAAGREHQLHAGGFSHQIFKNFMNSVGTGGNTAGTGANQNPAVIGSQLRSGSFSCLGEFLVIANH